MLDTSLLLWCGGAIDVGLPAALLCCLFFGWAIHAVVVLLYPVMDGLTCSVVWA